MDHKADNEEYSKKNKDTDTKIYQEILDARDSTKKKESVTKEIKDRKKAVEQEIGKITELIISAKNNQKII